MGAVEFHREQGHPWSCIAACVCIVKGWMGEEVDEPSLLAQWQPPLTARGHIGRIGEADHWEPSDPRSLDLVRDELREHWLIVIMYPGRINHLTRQRRPQPQSKHGRMFPFEDTWDTPSGMLHAVVLVEAVEPDSILYLDPYYPSLGQPFTLANEEFMQSWCGDVAIPVLRERPFDLLAQLEVEFGAEG